MTLTMTDLFCGAGGSSTGATAIPGLTVRLAANHWDLAIETHNANHPDTDHLQADISNTDPRYVPTTDILWASPECTNHSRAKGRKVARQPDLFGDVLPDAAAERSRATMWDVVRFTEVHGYKAILVENVVEVADWSAEWGERGGLFRSWLAAMHSMGYEHRVISLNSMHAQAYGLPAPQSRDRVYIAFWRKGDKAPDFEHMLRPKAYCSSCDEIVSAMQSFKTGDGSRPGRYRSQYVYRCPKISCRHQLVEPGWLPAETIIDWSNPGIRIGDREQLGMRALADKTLARIRAGIERYWTPIHLEAAGNAYDATNPRHPGHGREDGYIRAWPTSDPVRTVHTTVSKGMAWHPLMVPVEGRDGKQPMSAEDALRTMTTRNETGIVFAPLIVNNVSGSDSTRSSRVDDVVPTIVAGGTHASLVMPPLIAELRGGGSTARPASDPLATVTASGNHHALLMRMNNNRGDQSSLSTPVGEPARTVTTAGHQALLQSKQKTVDVGDVYFRMLEPGEIKQAMAFPADYLMAGNRREQVKLSGNAVTPPAARDLVATVAQAYGYAA
ncbi:DNA cytosine methyltransferase [Agrococcus sp. Marseille-Q4369]|uniref:DNA cytosine methyltransferase n=1 Tax=Agrococcus sp. Marseille-Q4369 TaxID=2810513 RepID=UPI001B8A9AF8|nr:DNA cytosine methyltransferase [Agrococcus sp. Marseille-Q4369]QUW18870.1 DNA cytosine methyltransferase [Agrococcus sp. Marseille-Q4369]